MPEQKSITIPARDVHKEDILHGRVVGEVTRGSKWASFRTANGNRIARVLLDEDVTVSRWFKTDEEKEQERQASLAEWKERELRRLQEELDEGLLATPQAALSKLAGEERSFRLLDHWQIDRLLRIQAEYDFFANVAGVLERWAQMDTPPEAVMKYREDPLMLAFALVVVQARQRRTADPLSRSTSTTANICEDLERYQAEAWLDSFHHYNTKALIALIQSDRDA